jgi:hypothetical protein
MRAIMDDKSSLPTDPANHSSIDADALSIRPMTMADIEYT